MIKTILLIAAIVVFGLATFNVAIGSANVVALGLGVLTGALLADSAGAK